MMKNTKLTLLAAAVAAVLALSATSATAATYQFRQAAKGIESPLVVPQLAGFEPLYSQYGAPAFAIASPASPSSASFTFSSSNPSVATVAGNVVTIVGAGATTITATQAAGTTFDTASTSTTLTVAKAQPTLAGFNPLAVLDNAAPFYLTPPSSNSPGALSFASSNAAVATLEAGGLVSIRGAGTTTLTATQAATANYGAGAISTTLTVSPSIPAGYFTYQGVMWTSRSTTKYSQSAGHSYCSGVFAGTTGWSLPTVPQIKVAKSAAKLTGPNINTWNQETFTYSQTDPTSFSGGTHVDGTPLFYVYCVKPT